MTPKTKYYKTLNLKPEAYEQLLQLAEAFRTEYTKANLGNLVAQLIFEKHQSITTKKEAYD